MNMQTSTLNLDAHTRKFYCNALTTLKQAEVPFLVGGAYAFERHTGIKRATKDLDLFARESDLPKILDTFAKAGYETGITVPHWLAKAVCGENFVDIIFASANGCLPVDDAWLDSALEDHVLDIPVLVSAPEEMIASKAYIMARNRYDGADIAHLIQACGDRMDWQRLLNHMGNHWRVLLSHLVLFGFIYPGERSQIPDWVMQQLFQKLEQETKHPEANEKLCQGTFLAPLQYRVDIEQEGYRDARLKPTGRLTQADVYEWTEHLQEELSE